MATGITGFLVYWFVPQWAAILKDLGLKDDELPAPTQLLISISNVVKNQWWIVLISLVVIVVAYKLFVSTRFGRRVADRVKLKIPVFGGLIRKIAVARFSRILSTLLSSGVPILQSLDITAKTAGNVVIEKAIIKVRAGVERGENFVDPLKATEVFPHMVGQMIGVGEQTGALDAMLGKIADFYEDEVDTAIADIRDLVKELKKRDIGVLITDHNVRETLDIVDRACIIYDGQVLFAGTPEALVADQEVRRLYLGESFAL